MINLLWTYLQGPQKVKYGTIGGTETVITAKNIIIATGSVPFVPKGVEVDGKCLFLTEPFFYNNGLKGKNIWKWK